MGVRFGVHNITWSVSRVVKLSKEQFEGVMEKAGAAWASVANITFSRLRNGSPHIMGSFQPTVHMDDGEHSNQTFHNQEVAHASLPCFKGDNRMRYIHMHDRWDWTMDGYPAVLDTVAHEMGHALGLGHTNGSEDLMNPRQRSSILSKDKGTVYFSDTDRQGIQALYGGHEEKNESKKDNKKLKWGPGREKLSTWIHGKWFLS